MPMPTPKQAAVAVGAATMILAASGAAVTLAKPFEGKSNTVYKDPVGIPTFCYGETHNVQYRTYTDAECDQLIENRMLETTKSVYACHPDIPIGLLVAASDFVYNVRNGLKIVCTGSIGKLINQQDYHGACMKITEYDKAGKKRLPGLTRRRAAEVSECSGQTPKKY